MLSIAYEPYTHESGGWMVDVAVLLGRTQSITLRGN
jgi:hypothetical protein